LLLWTFFWAAALLSVERVSYVWICRNPGRFGAFAARWRAEPVDALRVLFFGFKVLQAAVFLGWCFAVGDGRVWPPDGSASTIAAGGALIAAGQILSAAVFYQLGRAGVFYGTKFGHDLPWCRAFPFSLFDHPQYVGTVLSIWGFFVVMRFPHGDWLVLPSLETIYYVLGARLER
jgi:phosphatidyl-N-methylethanolamine N-methyltransferase